MKNLKTKTELSKKDILNLLKEISNNLKKLNTKGEIILYGGAVMAIVFNARKSTKDVDAIFEPAAVIRKIVKDIGQKKSLSETWLNDGIKGFIHKKGEYSLFYEDNNLKIFAATPEYILAMKCISMRLAESKDEEDIIFLIKKLKLADKESVFKIIEKYYPIKLIPAKTQFAIEELFERINNAQGI